MKTIENSPMWQAFQRVCEYIGQLTLVAHFVLFLFGIWQITQILDFLDPLRGAYGPLPQFGAIVATAGTLIWSVASYSDRQKYPKKLFRQRSACSVVITLVCLGLSFNLYYRLPES
jgi:hypothetical protein